MHPSIRRLLLCLAFLSLGLSLFAAEAAPRQELRRGKWEDDFGYRQAVRIGNTLYISGSVGAGDMNKAIPQAYDALKKTLEHFGLGFEHVVKETVFTTDLEALKAGREIRKPYYKGQYPAATWVQITRLFRPEYTIEVELIAVFPEAKK